MINPAVKVPISILISCLVVMMSSALVAAEDFQWQDMNDFEQEFDIPVVLTAARLRQSQLDTPASVTIIEAQDIAALGFKDIEDIFRLVPGMLVGYHSGFGKKYPSVSYHGTQAAEHRRMQVLIDGRSVYKPGLARVEWADIPLAVEDIDRIEVIRGPNSASYGANSYLGTINILTKHPQDESGTRIKLTTGMRNVANSYVNMNTQLANTSVRWTLGNKQDGGFDRLKAGEDNRDSVEAIYTNVNTHTQLGPGASLQVQAGYKTGVNGQSPTLDNVVYNSPNDIEADDVFAKVKFNVEYSSSQSGSFQVYRQDFYRVQEWNACLTDEMAENAGIPVYCGDLNLNVNEFKSELEYEHRSVWNDGLRSVAGARVRLDELNSEIYNNGYSHNTNSSLFTNVEYAIAPQWLANIGAMYEADDLNGEYLSPRVAINHHFNPVSTIRFIYSEAIRAPDLYEQGGQLLYRLENATFENGVAVGQDVPLGLHETSTDLEFEKIYSHEISYFTLLPSLSGQLDIKLFYDELSGLISQSLDLENPLTNENKITLLGLEGQMKWIWGNQNQMMLSWAYVENDDVSENNNGDIKKESRLSADRSGSLAWIRPLTPQTQLGAAYYHVENWNPEYFSGPFDFSRLDINVNHSLMLKNYRQLKLQAALQYHLDDDPLLFDNNVYSDDLFVYASAQIEW